MGVRVSCQRKKRNYTCWVKGGTEKEGRWRLSSAGDAPEMQEMRAADRRMTTNKGGEKQGQMDRTSPQILGNLFLWHTCLQPRAAGRITQIPRARRWTSDKVTVKNSRWTKVPGRCNRLVILILAMSTIDACVSRPGCCMYKRVTSLKHRRTQVSVPRWIGTANPAFQLTRRPALLLRTTRCSKSKPRRHISRTAN